MKKDLDQFKICFEKFSGKLMGVATRYFDEKTSEELVQNIFIDLFNKANKNIFHDFNDFSILKEGLMKKIMVEIDKNNIVFDINKFKNINEATISEDWREINITTKELVSLINDLEPLEKYVFNLSLIDGFSDSEISKIFNINENNVRPIYFSAKSQLANKLNSNLCVSQ